MHRDVTRWFAPLRAPQRVRGGSSIFLSFMLKTGARFSCKREAAACISLSLSLTLVSLSVSLFAYVSCFPLRGYWAVNFSREHSSMHASRWALITRRHCRSSATIAPTTLSAAAAPSTTPRCDASRCHALVCAAACTMYWKGGFSLMFFC